ncbi:IS21-like element helper ATPase IstB [Pelotomaculum propionicicum]|uniref:Insertion sequence IS5376 putative ATP-binding protein n=1 Tax=Pelotomaculum propionicicum TaxID=258475 RepID=A0A4Y7RBF4_9FIRM|nr:IS21-like element helper ATPase IstB [Pelotomaculum propionicicum]TEB06338.1 Insertion sequence IS5376 putative ATP-binding protein [Pelotomaculum propionicicum]
MSVNDIIIRDYLKRLKLPAIARHYQDLAREAADCNRPYEEYLSALLEQEVISREESTRKNRISRANLPYIKTLEGFDFAVIPALNKQKVLQLSQCNFVKQKENVALLGNSGTGKTHLSIALALCACRHGYRVRYWNASGLVTHLLLAQREHRLLQMEKQWLKQDLVVVDEVGFVPYTPEGAQLFFRFMASRYERGSIIVTSNLEFSQWSSVFGEERLTDALLDRLTHQCHILLMNGDSYRFRQSISRQEKEVEKHPDKS